MKFKIKYLLGGSWMLLQSAAFAECNLSLKTDTPSDQFTVVDEQFIVDGTTGLMWHRCALGAIWQNVQCVKSVVDQSNWAIALSLANNSVIASYDDWRLPNRKELESIVDRRCSDPAINTQLFPNFEAGLYWTSTPNSGRDDASWVVDFSTGAHRNLIKSEPGRGLLVRDEAPPGP